MAEKGIREAGDVESARRIVHASESSSQQDEEISSDEAENVGAGVQAPSQPVMKWVYNSNHTDRLNFGYMQLVPVDSPSDVLVPVPVQVPRTSGLPGPSRRHPSVTGPSQASKSSNEPLPSGFATASEFQGQRRSSVSQAPRAPRETSSFIPSVVEGGVANPLPIPSSGVSNPSSSAQAFNSFATTASFEAIRPQVLPPTPDADVFLGGQWSSANQQKSLPQSFYPQTSTSFSNTSPYQLAYRQSPHQNASPYQVPPQQLTPSEDVSWRVPSHHHRHKKLTFSRQHPDVQQSGNVQSSTQLLNEDYLQHSSTHTAVTTLNSAGNYFPTTKRRYESSSPGSSTAEASESQRSPPPVIAKRRRPVNGSLGGQITICWRCQRAVSVGIESGVCDSCLQEFNLNVCPSTRATRKGNLESLVIFLLPSHMEDVLLQGPPSLARNPSWRGFTNQRPHLEYDFDALTTVWDSWTAVNQQARSTRLWGDDFAELAAIARSYQMSLPKPNLALDAAAQVMAAVCNFYKCFVKPNPTISSFTPMEMLIENVRSVRISMRNAFVQLQYLALSPSELRGRQDWLPSFLSAAILASTAITYLDILVACPSPFKEKIWGKDWINTVREMRHGGYGILINLLSANTNGINPLKMDCWAEEEPPPAASFVIETPISYLKKKTGYPEGTEAEIKIPKKKKKKKRLQPVPQNQKENERNILLGYQSPAAKDGLLALKSWQARFDNDLKIGENMYGQDLYMQAMMRPVASLWRIFNMQ